MNFFVTGWTCEFPLFPDVVYYFMHIATDEQIFFGKDRVTQLLYVVTGAVDFADTPDLLTRGAALHW